MPIPVQLTDNDTGTIAAAAAKKIIDSDNWVIEQGVPDAALKGAPWDVETERGQKCTLVIIVQVIPHPAESLEN